ncbi:hypothetical protein N7493_009240 [Penicillium malachiteum]|uniref:Allergen Asp f 7 n=1 Tax=Penicillium malachiteum TaxID=1324776 RepID=A0AAD6MTE4_9EURO|nr:hypothetical protein N7493_009240 [Penicillium malachiteum]
MSPFIKNLALAGALFSAAGFAAPIDKREVIVWETVTDVVWTTVDVTTTLQPEQFVATATLVPVTHTTAPAAVAVESTPAAQPQPEETDQPESTSSTPTTTSTAAPAPAPEPTEQATTSSAASAPETTESAQPVERTEPATTAEPTTSTTAASTAASVSSSSSDGYTGSCDSGSPCVGQMTYYDTATSWSAPSACDTTNDGLTELVLALPHGIMTNDDCGKTVTIEYNGVTKQGTVVDKCMGCDDSSIDLSQALFEVFDSLSAGRLYGAKWYIN